MRKEQTRSAVFALLLAGWVALCGQTALAAGAATVAPRQAQAAVEDWDAGGEDAGAEAPAEGDAGDSQPSSGDWDDGAANVVKGRTSSEQQAIGQAEEKLRAALHAEVTNPELSIEASLGYGGIVSYARPVPVDVTLRNTGADMDGAVCVDLYRTSSSYDRVEYPLYLPAGSEKRVRFYVTLTMKQDVFTVAYRSGDTVLASANVSPSKAVSPGICLIGALSSGAGSLSYLNIDAQHDPLLRGEYFQTVPLDAGSFPDTAEALDAFGVLAVDGADLTALDDAQKVAFATWLKAGGVAIVGGGAQAAAGYPFFEALTGARAGALYQAEDITPALFTALGETGEALGQGMLLNRLDAGENAIARFSGGDLAALYRVGDGAVFLAAFELGARPLTDWADIGTLWQRIMLKWVPDAYTDLFSGSGYDDRDDYRSSQVLSTLPVKDKAAPRTLILWLLFGFVAVSGVGMYLVLKKLDRRELLWLTMPILAVLASFLIFRIGVVGGSADPIATSYAWITLDADGQSDITTGVGAATPIRSAMRLSAGGDITLEPPEQNGFEDKYYDNTTFFKTPSQLRYVRTLGAENSVTLPAQAAWTMNALNARNNRAFEGRVSASIWMEDDGLHGRVKNDTAYPLTDCAVITSAGYADMGDLAPGQEAAFCLLKLTDQEADHLKAAKAADDYDFAPEGRIIGASPDGTSGLADPNVIFDGAVTKEYRIEDRAKRAEAYQRLDALERAQRPARQDLIFMSMDRWAYSGGWWGSGSDPFFRFCGFSDQAGAVHLTMDGKPVARSAHLALVDAEIAYQSVSPTGLVLYPLGMIPAHVAEAAKGAPTLGEAVDRDHSFRVTTNPTFGFQIPDANALEDLSITLQSRYDAPPTIQLYNAQAGAWDDMSPAVLSLKGDELAPYVDADGTLFLRYEPGPKSDGYQEIATPVISVSGRVRT
jgi:hypothetical protein